MALFALILAVFALFCCAYLWLELQKKPSKDSLRGLLLEYSEGLSKTSEKQVRELETEWLDMYSKFTRLAGRIDKTKAIESPVPAQEPAPIEKRSDILRRRKRGLPNE